MSVIVLMYHHVSPHALPLSLTPEVFEGQLRWFRAQGYTFLRQAEFEAVMATPDSRRGRFVLVTFDDGCTDVFEHALPILRELGVPSTHFVITERLEKFGDDGYFGWAEAEQMVASGLVELASHSHRHVRYDRDPVDRSTVQGRLEEDLIQSREALARRLGYVSNHLAWPWGCNPPEYRQIATRLGFEWQYQAYLGRSDGLADQTRIPRIRTDGSLAPVFGPWMRLWSSQVGLLMTLVAAAKNARSQRLTGEDGNLLSMFDRPPS